MTQLAGHHAIITGGGTGIGASIARAFAQAGAAISIIGRRATPLADIAAETGATTICADVSDAAQVSNAFSDARHANGKITILIANAGAAHSSALESTSDADWHGMIAANLTSTFYCIREALGDVRAADHGRIIAIASTAALKGYAYSSAYAAAKHGVLGLIRSLAIELAETNATANALCPGFTDTEIITRAVDTISTATGRDTAAARKVLMRFNPQKRFIDPSEVARAALWLCQPGAHGITGQALSISGGETM